MRKTMLSVVIISIVAFAGLLPFQGTDVGKLHPIEVIIVSCDKELISVETDTGLRGTGGSVDVAINELKIASAGEIFLDTANYVLINENNMHILNELFRYLRPACQVYVFSGNGVWDNVAKYLEAHPSDVTLLSYKQRSDGIPKLFADGEDYRIER